ncbi:hypothetical protein D3C81_1452640 [compost metagenome]
MLAVFVVDVGQDVVGVGSFGLVLHFDVRQLEAADDGFLASDRLGVPALHVVQIFLDDGVAAAGEVGVLVADQGGGAGDLGHGVLRAVDEAQKVAVVEEFEAVDLVLGGHGVAQAIHDVHGQLEAEVRARGADVQQDVARGRDSAVNAVDLAEGMQILRAGRAEQPIPGL